MVFTLTTFHGVRYSLFAYRPAGAGGHADFDSINIVEAVRRTIPFGKKIQRSRAGTGESLKIGTADEFVVVDRGLGRVALKANGGCLRWRKVR